jgi:hypothetical protein
MIAWPDLTFPPINLWNAPRLWCASELVEAGRAENATGDSQHDDRN